jgi:hypothetical protein
MCRFKSLLLFVFVFLIQAACSMETLSRNMSLKAFDPYRDDFICKHEADVAPPIDAEAEQWNQQALALTSRLLWPEDRDHKKAIQFWQKAAERKHWKAILNLANAYAQGEGVNRDTEKAVQIVEAAMKLGIPGAYDLMGTYHMEGLGVKQDASRAYAFWELAADMGSASAQAYLGDKLKPLYGDPQRGRWGNRKVGLKMLECSFAQSNGKAAFALGLTLEGTDKSLGEDSARALFILHEGVKFGSADCANYLFATFDNGESMVNNIKDRSRAERYSVLSDILERDPDLRFPNLDKVLPLPPAALPQWNGDKQTLIDAAKAVLSVPPSPPKPVLHASAQRTGRAHIPEGWTLPDRPQIEVAAQYETTSAPKDGYWIARLLHSITEQHRAWDAAQVPMHYARGELFDRSRPGLRWEDGRIRFHYLGEAVSQPATVAAPDDPRVAQGIARYGDVPELALRCKGHAPCPKTGVWAATVAGDHPHAAVFNRWERQAYVSEGGRFPDPRVQHLEVEPREVVWRWLGQANTVLGDGMTRIGIDALSAHAA